MTETVTETWNMACPECGADDQIDIAAQIWIRLCPDGTDAAAAANGDHEWRDTDAAVCHGCGHQSTVAAFTRKA
jgi:Pyruvate/2-oxoacid:ferredoxin oxidoreductase delta subunit